MAREGRSHVRKRKKGCLVGCLTNLMLLLGVIALVFVGAHVLGFVESDPQTGAPTLKLDHLPEIRLGDFDLSQIQPPDLSGMTEKLPKWAYGVNANGLTVKTLRAGDGEAVFVCADGYTMLLGAGSGTGALLCGQLLLCGANHLSAAVAMSSEDEQLGAMKLALGMTKPDYLFVPPTQTKGKAYAQMIDAAEKQGTQIVSAAQNMTFTLGRARVTFIGPARTQHTDSRDDGLTLRIDYGQTSVVVTGCITSNGEKEIVSSGAAAACDALIVSRGGTEAATCAEWVEAAKPKVALITGKNPANSVRIRLQKYGAPVSAAKENGVMTLFSDGQEITVEP